MDLRFAKNQTYPALIIKMEQSLCIYYARMENNL